MKSTKNLRCNIAFFGIATHMEAMRKEIARLKEVIGKGWIGKTQSNDKKNDESKGPQFK